MKWIINRGEAHWTAQKTKLILLTHTHRYIGPVEKGCNRSVLIIYQKTNGCIKLVINALGKTVLLVGWSRLGKKLLRCLSIKSGSRRRAWEPLMWKRKSTIMGIKMYWSCCNDWHTGIEVNHLFKDDRHKNNSSEYVYKVMTY